MEREIARWSYWLGVVCGVLAMLWRGLIALGLPLTGITTLGNYVAPMTLYKGAVLFLLAGIATANYTWLKRQTP